MSSRTKTSRERDRVNNMLRERKRRAITTKIISGLKMYGNYNLRRQCDFNEVLKALCHEAGWTVERDGTTYRKGQKPITSGTDMIGGGGGGGVSLSPFGFHNPSLGSSSCFSSRVSSHTVIPWFESRVSSSSSSTPSASSKHPHHLFCRTSCNPFVPSPSSMPLSPGCQVALPISPTFGVVSQNRHEPLSGIWTPNSQLGGTCFSVQTAADDLELTLGNSKKR